MTSPAAPAPVPSAPLWRDTQAGRAEAWIRDGMRQRREMRLEWPVGRKSGEKRGNN